MKLSTWLQSLAHHATPNMDECVHMLGTTLPWLLRLKETPQDPEWHAEGDVHTHTDWVLRELYQLLATDAQHIQGERRQALILGAILHDIAKAVRTKTVEIKNIERIVAPQHESIGRAYLAFKLPEYPLSFTVIWQVLNLVGEHHMPKQLMLRNPAQHLFWQLARQVDIELLYWLEIADMRGRICQDLTTQLQYLAEFRFFAEEYHVWGETPTIHPALATTCDTLSETAQQYVYANALYAWEQGRISLPEEAIAITYPYRDQHSHLIILCGPSGSGKSTWVTQHYADYHLVSLDELRASLNGDRSSQKHKGQIIQAAKAQLKSALRQSQNVIWDATNLRFDFRQMIAGLGRDYHALVTLVVFLLPETQLLHNNRQRQASVPDSVLLKQITQFEFPSLNEVHQCCFIGEKGVTLWRSGYY